MTVVTIFIAAFLAQQTPAASIEGVVSQIGSAQPLK